MKRSYTYSGYDSPACCLVVIGKNTNKVIDIVVKQKTCSKCDYAFSQGLQVKEHECYRNHGKNLSSTSMESAAVVEAFGRSIEKHNLIYKTLISDGDSSNFKAVLNSNPYGAHGVEVDNILCANHIKRNVATNFKVLAKKKGKFGSLRQIISNSIPKFIEAITTATTKIKEKNCNLEKKCRELRYDINKLQWHIFGDHTYCGDNNYDCHGQSNEQNIVPQLEKLNLFNDIEQCLYRATSNAKSLIHDVTTNKAESFNALIVKTINAKRINFAKQDSYKSRCHIAVLNQITSRTLEPFCEVVCKSAPVVGKTLQDKRARKNQLRNLRLSVVGIEKKRKNYETADADYGLQAHQPDADQHTLKVLIDDHKNVLEEWRQKRELIELNTRDQSLSAEWRTKRKWLITASKMGKICKKRPETSCASYVTDILYPSRKESAAMAHGVAMEVVAKEILKTQGYDVRPCGLFLDPEILGLAGTPDGLIGEDGILEVKCPYSAKDMEVEEAVQNKKIPISRAVIMKDNKLYLKENHEYYYQVQGQLRVTGRTYCLFVIFTLKNLTIINVPRNEEFIKEMIKKVSMFYNDCLLLEIVDSRKRRYMPIRDPDYIIKAQQNSRKEKEKMEIES